MNHLIILCGAVGCGKTTLIKKFLKKHKSFANVDVFNYIKKYKKDKAGHIKQSDTVKAYLKMYNNIRQLKKNLIVEIGTNNAELNIKNLSKLTDRYQITIIFCLLDIKTCLERTLAQNKKISKKDLLERYKRIFPDNHIKLAQQAKLHYLKLNMALPHSKRLEAIDNIINK